MRTIKFRGQRIDNGEWVYGYLYQLPLPSGVGCMILTTDNIHEDNSIEPEYHLAFTLWVDLFPVKPKTVCQFTGLTDNDGHDIYEGDVVKRTPDINGYCPIMGVVRYNEESAQFVLTDKYGKGHPFISKKKHSDGKVNFYVRYSYTLMGNIYDDPELLPTKD